MTILVDTSAFYALLDDDDVRRAEVVGAFVELRSRRLLTHNYVVLEAAALVHRRLGGDYVKLLFGNLLAPIEMFCIDRPIHDAAVGAYLASGKRSLSLVDFTSFEVMRKLGIRTAFAVDRDFADAGFDVIPA